ncbi:hypothetical protein JL721_10609 [Aureococcus anophagefferens]|nr:hypothetical protein JL721_10609 [Aureococcus anophagefferens]
MLSTTTALPTETSWGDTLKSYQAERGLASWDKLGEAHPPKDHRVTHYEKRSKFNPLLQRHYDPRRERAARASAAEADGASPLRSTSSRSTSSTSSPQQYISDHKGRTLRDRTEAKHSAQKLFWETHDFDPLLGRYYDAGKEADFAKQRAVLSSIAGQGSVARLPPAVQYCEGAAYDIVSHAVKDQAKLEVASGVGNRAIASKKGPSVEAELRDRSNAPATSEKNATSTERFAAPGATATPKPGGGSAAGATPGIASLPATAPVARSAVVAAARPNSADPATTVITPASTPGGRSMRSVDGPAADGGPWSALTLRRRWRRDAARAPPATQP